MMFVADFFVSKLLRERQAIDWSGWWRHDVGFLKLAPGHHHNEMIEDNPKLFGVPPEVIQAEQDKEDYDYSFNTPMMLAALQHGWVRMGMFNGEYRVHVWRNPKLARDCAVAMSHLHPPTRIDLDIDTDGTQDGIRTYVMLGDDVERFLKTGKVNPRNLVEAAPPQGAYDYWDLVSHFKLDKEAERYGDAGLPWINRNNAHTVERLIKSKKMRLVSMLKLYIKHVAKVRDFNKKALSPEAFQAALDQPLTMWRGGGGTYDPHHDLGRTWCSFTLDKQRVQTFSKYIGTYATRATVLSQRNQHWTVELTLPIKDILFYFDQGWDEEVIVATRDAINAKLVEQT